MKIIIIGVGQFRQIMKAGKISVDIPSNDENPPTVYTVLHTIDAMYGGQFAKELYLEDGSENLWTRIMLNGRDIRFLDQSRLFIKDGDTVLVSTVMAGG